ncbi:cyclic nucleotide-binding domain-containing protein [Casimicrobium huifangae]|uniref:cyclic nucleotide-binding domain-containing protein n=1 Tax=Casimicrobium huifangae TaxID=2591109 RepID=UPI003782D83B
MRSRPAAERTTGCAGACAGHDAALDAEADQTLARTGQTPAWLYYVLSGEVRLIRHTPDGRVAVMQRVQRGPVAEASIGGVAAITVTS